MANYRADNYNKISYSGEYGNVSVAHCHFDNIGAINGSAGFANGDTADLFQLPAGARPLRGYVYVGSNALETSTIMLGVKYADGTSTGGSTGSAVLFAGTGSAVTAAHTRYDMRFTPMTFDADTIVYLSWQSPGAPTDDGNPVDVVLEYVATGQS